MILVILDESNLEKFLIKLNGAIVVALLMKTLTRVESSSSIIDVVCS